MSAETKEAFLTGEPRRIGRNFGAEFTEIEARWMRDQEWATTTEDCLWRRSKLGLHMTEGEQAAFQRWWLANATL